MKLTFTNPCAFSGDALAASFGFAGAPVPEEAAVRTAPVELEGVLLTGLKLYCCVIKGFQSSSTL